jgi:hypothetical protein
MNDPRPTEAGREESPGRTTPSVTHEDDDLRDLRWEMRGRLHAVLQELDVRPPDWDVIETLLRGALEDVEAAL